MAGLGGSAWAQAFPIKPVVLVVPNPPGGGVDTSARFLIEPLAKLPGQAVVIENKGGASNPSLFSKLPMAQKDFVPVALLTAATNVIAAHPSVPVATLKEFIAYAKVAPDALGALVQRATDYWAQVIKAKDIKAD